MNDDITEIQQLLYRYCHALDRSTVDDVMDVFHPNAVLQPRYEGDESYSGAEAIRGWYMNYEKTIKGSTRNLRHKVTCPWIQVNGGEGNSVCYLDADYVDSSTGAFVLAAGRYEDKLVKEDGRWWIKERVILIDGFHLLSKKSHE